jgi:hypothetical protein
MDAGEIDGFAAPAWGDWLQAGSAAPASVAATPDDAPTSKSLRDKFSGVLELEMLLIVASSALHPQLNRLRKVSFVIPRAGLRPEESLFALKSKNERFLGERHASE